MQSSEPENPYVVAGTVLQASYVDFINFEMNGCTLSGFKITGLNENHNPIKCENSSPTIANCHIINNRGYFNGVIYCEKSSARITNCKVESNRSNSGAGAIYCNRSNVNILDCLVSNNYSYESGAVFCMDHSNLNISGSSIFGNKNRPALRSNSESMLNVENSIIAGNQSGGIYCEYSNVNIENVVITKNCNSYNDGEAIYSRNSQFFITNSIIWDNNTPGSAWEGAIWLTNSSAATVNYSDIQYGKEGIWSETPHKLIWDIGNINTDPCFVDPGNWDPNGTPAEYSNDYWVHGNYHLKSYGWRWIDGGSNWTWDYSTSRCIDAGNPGCSLSDEAITIPRDPDNEFGVNLRINMGAYGGTVQASMAPPGYGLLSDTDNNGRTDINDLNLLIDMWLDTGDKLNTDFDHDGNIDFVDFALLATEWFEISDWY
ncbi:MAG: hypothetical protein A2Y12_11525 [Planctomycetes bacterium GWF2_42_9]|nr:MAG: hypothetical protein A2Y12_11525 [Planctomycetes bacterium GWF2_42_9]